MYVIETSPSGSRILRDFSRRELSESRAKWGPDGWIFHPVPPSYAHAWVKRGDVHSTDLWLDAGRIRRAGPGAYD